ncbi:MAG: hypothetical protein K8953_04955, partial [Proteobacteria bacterium]|nr:hypothetical protein [Pseudomonadota bacterium]
MACSRESLSYRAGSTALVRGLRTKDHAGRYRASDYEDPQGLKLIVNHSSLSVKSCNPFIAAPHSSRS